MLLLPKVRSKSCTKYLSKKECVSVIITSDKSYKNFEIDRGYKENDINLGTFVMKGSSFAVNVKEDLLKAIDEMPKNKIRKLYWKYNYFYNEIF